MEKDADEWTGRAEINKKEIPGSKRSMYGYILIYSRLLPTAGHRRKRFASPRVKQRAAAEDKESNKAKAARTWLHVMLSD